MKNTACRACGIPLSRSFIDLGMSPLSNSYVHVEDEGKAEKFYPLHAFICEQCFLVQLAEFETPEHIFSEDYAYYSSFSTSWLKHAEKYTGDMIARFHITKDSHVVEVASNDGYLLQYFHRRGIPVTGIEPAGACAEAARKKGVETETVFFGVKTAQDIAQRRGKADLMAANNVLAHVPDIRDFVGGFAAMLKPEGVATFEFPHLLNLIQLNQFDTIYHEHFSYLALRPVQQIFEAQGLKVIDVQELPTHGGSLRVFAALKTASHAVAPAVQAMIDKETKAGLYDFKVYDDYAERVIGVKDAVLEFLIKAHRDGKKVCGYGAPAKGNTLLNYCGVKADHLKFTVDQNPAKQKTLLPGTRIPVLALSAIDDFKPDYLFILPWNLKDEISRQMAHIRDWGGQFVTAVPALDIF
jgi:2-polyprenyl-3-methyl-5-hydroxy-6-metoxy-1,4-benzoquinol methylase